MRWLRQTGLEAAILKAADAGTLIFGVCGGYQMLGRTVSDPEQVEAAKALGAWRFDGNTAPARPTPLSPRAALEVLKFEAMVVAVAGGNVARGVTLSDPDRSRVMQAAGRINHVAGMFA